MLLQSAGIKTPLGALLVFTRRGALCGLTFHDHRQSLLRALEKRFGVLEIEEGRAPSDVVAAIKKYFAGDLGALRKLKLDMGGTPFERAVWAALRRVPAGRTASYADIARTLGKPKAVRAVGLARTQPRRHRRPVPPCDPLRRLSRWLRGRSAAQALAAGARGQGHDAHGRAPEARDEALSNDCLGTMRGLVGGVDPPGECDRAERRVGLSVSCSEPPQSGSRAPSVHLAEWGRAGYAGDIPDRFATILDVRTFGATPDDLTNDAAAIQAAINAAPTPQSCSCREAHTALRRRSACARAWSCAARALWRPTSSA